MNWSFDEPSWLYLLILCGIPYLLQHIQRQPYSSHRLLPDDLLSKFIDFVIRTLGALAIGLTILGIAGLQKEGEVSYRTGNGADIVMLLDRSASMDNSFAGRQPSGVEESKSHAAKRLLGAFIDSRQHDRVGVVGFSTSPLFILPLTANKIASQAAIATLDAPGLAYTNVSKGLSMALDLFELSGSPPSRLVLLVSDGAAEIDPATENQLRAAFLNAGTRLYWIFLRTANSPGIYSQPNESLPTEDSINPERQLHAFFSSLGIPYQAFEAENPNAVALAIAEINRLENAPLVYRSKSPRLPLNHYCYGLAALCLLLLLWAKRYEIRIFSYSTI